MGPMSTIAAILRVAYYVIMAYGVYVSWQAFRVGRKKAWLYVGVFCLSAFLGLLAGAARSLLYQEAQVDTQYEHLTAQGDEVVPVKTISVNLPIFPLLLVVGLSLLAEEEIKKSPSTTSQST